MSGSPELSETAKEKRMSRARLKSIFKKFENFVSASQTSRNQTKRLTLHIYSQHGTLKFSMLAVTFETKMLRKKTRNSALFCGSVSQAV